MRKTIDFSIFHFICIAVIHYTVFNIAMLSFKHNNNNMSKQFSFLVGLSVLFDVLSFGEDYISDTNFNFS